MPATPTAAERVAAAHRLLVVTLLGFASGLPLALTGQAMQAWLSVEGLDIATIGFLSLVGLPYTFKFLWAPLMDRFDWPLLGRRRGWLVLTQLALAGVQQVGAVGVDDDVLRGGHEGHEYREQRKGARGGARGRGGEREQHGGERELREHEPAAAPAEQRPVEAVHQGRPQELEGVGQADQAEEADGGDVEPFDAEPGLHALQGACPPPARRPPAAAPARLLAPSLHA